MDMGAYPCFSWSSDEGVDAKSLLSQFLKSRPSENWMLLAEHTVLSDVQMWTAWIQASRNFERGDQLARSKDAEMLRYLCGTHHVSHAFRIGGITEGATAGWLAYIPGATFDGEQPLTCEVDAASVAEESQQLAQSLGLTLRKNRPQFTDAFAELMQIEVGQMSNDDALVAHVLQADFQS